jgi:hypothetical protein
MLEKRFLTIVGNAKDARPVGLAALGPDKMVLVLSLHGMPHSETLHALHTHLGVPVENIYGSCKLNYCGLTGTGVHTTGFGSADDYWGQKQVTGTDPCLLRAADKIDRMLRLDAPGAPRKGFNFNDLKRKFYMQYFNGVLVNDAAWAHWNVTDNGYPPNANVQTSFDAYAGPWVDLFDTVICPFPSVFCAPFLSPKYKINVVIRLTHRFNHQVDPGR